MPGIIADRILFYSEKNSDVRNELIIRISSPFKVKEGEVDFVVGEQGAVGCRIETQGLDSEYIDNVYGIDSVQALNLATNLEPFLHRLSKKYDLFWDSGDPYFDG